MQIKRLRSGDRSLKSSGIQEGQIIFCDSIHEKSSSSKITDTTAKLLIRKPAAYNLRCSILHKEVIENEATTSYKSHMHATIVVCFYE